MGLRITVGPNRRVVINGAVIRNRCSRTQMDIYVENHASVVREKNIMQLEEATTPARRAFFAAQSILLEPGIDDSARLETYLGLLDDLAGVFSQPTVVRRLAESRRLAEDGALYKSMMSLKPVISYEDAVFAYGQAASALNLPSTGSDSGTSRLWSPENLASLADGAAEPVPAESGA